MRREIEPPSKFIVGLVFYPKLLFMRGVLLLRGGDQGIIRFLSNTAQAAVDEPGITRPVEGRSPDSQSRVERSKGCFLVKGCSNIPGAGPIFQD